MHSSPPLADTMLVPVVYRDFKFSRDVPDDFELGVTGSTSPFQGMVNSALDANGKPAYSGIGGNAHVTSAASFAEWLSRHGRDKPRNPDHYDALNNGQGAYVNRYGANGEQWLTTETAYFRGTWERNCWIEWHSHPCTSEYANEPMTCSKKVAAGETNAQVLHCQRLLQCHVHRIQGRRQPLFFPVDGDTFTPATELTAAQIPPYYDPMGTGRLTWMPRETNALHNFSFTSEVRYWFPL